MSAVVAEICGVAWFIFDEVHYMQVGPCFGSSWMVIGAQYSRRTSCSPELFFGSPKGCAALSFSISSEAVLLEFVSSYGSCTASVQLPRLWSCLAGAEIAICTYCVMLRVGALW
jgi:hypothetical protein